MFSAGGGYILSGLTVGEHVACQQPGCIRIRYNSLEYQQILKIGIVKARSIKIIGATRLKVQAGNAITKYQILD